MAEFIAEEKDLLQSVSALKSAITVLSKHHGGALMQVPRSHILGVAATVEHEMQKHSHLFQCVFTHVERKVIQAFIRQSITLMHLQH